VAILGAHQSIAGGYYKAVDAARQCGCQCVQLFTKNNNQWRAKPISDEEAARFKATLAAAGIQHPLSHDSYLINLGAPPGELWDKSVAALVVELQRAEQLGIPYVVTHPGAHTIATLEEGIAQVVRALDEVHARTPGLIAQVLLENTAGQGSTLGWRFEHLAAMLEGVQDSHRLGVCIDTCHTFAAGYSLAPKKDYQTTFRDLDRLIGLRRIRAFHLNDSKKPLGSRVDRHEHIGKGCLGLEPFRLLLNDRRFRKIPMYLETPKEADGEFRGEELDRMNLATLRGLIDEK
jgi:deoxyribonuclease-4